uniref:SH3 domain-containing protein n=1 Tax=Syphacia muris TaxID=451379 RepID=A0A0N5AA89_9BILA
MSIAYCLSGNTGSGISPSTSTGSGNLPVTVATIPHPHLRSQSLSDTLLLALRQRPSTRLFRALFQYIPVRDSPNDNPQLELPLQEGDYIFVYGEMDEDQFYHGETLDGQTGLVPSNYVERVTDEHLLSNSTRAPSPSFPLTVPHHLTQIQHDFSINCSNDQILPDSVCPYPAVDVSNVTVQEIKQIDVPRVD